MDNERMKKLAKGWFMRLWSGGDLDIADVIVDPDYAPEWIQIPKRGPEQVKHEVRYFRSVFPDLKYEIVDTAILPDRVWVRYKGYGTQEGDAWGFEATGKKVEFEGVAILYVNETGKIIDRWGAFCMYEILVELGHIPSFWELKSFLETFK